MSNLAYCLYFFIKSDMKNFSRIVGISTICAFLFLGFATKASTGETTTGTTIAYTGSLLTYLTTQKSSISSSLTTTYTKLYAAFTKT